MILDVVGPPKAEPTSFWLSARSGDFEVTQGGRDGALSQDDINRTPVLNAFILNGRTQDATGAVTLVETRLWREHKG